MADLFPDSAHVRDVGLKAVADRYIWEQAKDNGYVIVSKDSDFYQRSLLYGQPPKVIWIRRGNCSTGDIEKILRDHFDEITRFEKEHQETFLILL
jgi:predicted nuclease of predicted toxin-antitoxin system